MCRVVDTGCCWYVVLLTLVVCRVAGLSLTLVVAGVSCRVVDTGCCWFVVDSGCCWCVVLLTLVVAGVSWC